MATLLASLIRGDVVDYYSRFPMNGAFVVGETALADLYEHIRAYLGEDPKISVKLQGDNSVSSTLPEIFSSLYVKSNQINGITIEGRTIGSSASVEMGLSSPPVTISVSSGDPEAGLKLRSQLEQIMNASRPWYRWLSNSILHTPTLVVTVAAAFILWCVVYFFGYLAGGDAATVSGLAGLAVFWLMLVVGWFKKIVFPPMIFLIGVSAKRDNTGKFLRNAFYIFSTSIVTGLIVWLLTK